MRLFLAMLLLNLIAPVMAITMGSAEVTTSITSDGSLGTQVTQNGNIFNIDQGTIKGSNQFHSFDSFNVESGHIASFNGPAGIQNILSRVTGGNPSQIYGTIRSTINGANLFFMNPAGVMFGPTASLDVKGSFHVTTADYLRLTDDVTFTAISGPSDAVLSVASVAAFGFLEPKPADITINQSVLEVPYGKTFSIMAGNIDIVGDYSFETGRLRAPSGEVKIVSVASSGEIIANTLDLATNIKGQSFQNLGEVAISQGAGINASGESGGTVTIRSGQFVLDFADVFADTRGNLNGSPIGIDIAVTGKMEIFDGFITTDVKGDGNAGDIIIEAGSLHLEGTPFEDFDSQGNPIPSALIGSRSDQASGNSGNVNVTITSGDMKLKGKTEITTTTFNTGEGGDINIVVENGDVSIVGTSNPDLPTGIFANTFGSKNSGILIIKSQNFQISQGASVQSGATSSGNGGQVIVDVTNNLDILEGASILTSSNSVDSDAGNAGNINLKAGDTIRLVNAKVTTAAENAFGGKIKFDAGNLIHVVNSEVTSRVKEGSADAGSIDFDPRFIIVQNSLIDTSNSGFGGGDGGPVSFLASSAILLDPFSTIDTSSQFGGSGAIDIQAPIQNLSGTIAPLPHTPVNVAALYASRCAAQKNGQFSSFVHSAHEGIPPAPGGLLSSPPFSLEGMTSSLDTGAALHIPSVRLTGLDDSLAERWTAYRRHGSSNPFGVCVS